MNDKELVDYLDARIRKVARWNVKRPSDPVTGMDTEDDFKRVGKIVFDCLVGQYPLDGTLVKAARAVGNSWGVGYVIRIIRAASKDGLLYESIGADVVSDVLTEETFGRGRLGGGLRFRACVEKMKTQGAKDPEAVCASIGRKKYGKRRFAQLSAQGKK